LGDLAQLQDRINRAFSDTYGRGSGPSRHDEGLMTTGTWAPPVDIYQNADQELVLTAELPDMSPDDIEITINNDTLTIRGEKRFSSEVKEDQCHRIERRYGSFSRSFSLPSSVDATKIAAYYERAAGSARPAGCNHIETRAVSGFRGQKGARPDGSAAIPGIPGIAVCVTYRI
jgi:HSP20 family protein